jgi:hypothetical protein
MRRRTKTVRRPAMAEIPAGGLLLDGRTPVHRCRYSPRIFRIDDEDMATIARRQPGLIDDAPFADPVASARLTAIRCRTLGAFNSTANLFAIGDLR